MADKDDLNAQEGEGAEVPANKAEQSELGALQTKTESPNETEEPSFYHPEVKKRFGRKSQVFGTATGSRRRIKKLLFIGGPLAVILIIVFVLGSIFLGQLKEIHFATVLRSSGFATFQFQMNQFFSDVAFDKTIMTPDSTGRLKDRPDSQLLKKLITGHDPRTVAEGLGREGSFNYVVENGKIKGFEFSDGTRVNYDDIAQKLFRKNADNLSIREEMTLKKSVVDEIQLNLGERLGVETRGFRNDFWTGFRELTGIRMNTPLQVIRDMVGKKPIDAEVAMRLDEENYTTNGAGKVSSGISELNDAVDKEAEEVTQSTKLGERLRNPDFFNNALSKMNVNPEEFASGVSKASPYVLVGTIYCIGHDLGQTSDRINQSLEMRAARYAHDQQTTAEQIMNGTNVNAQYVSAANADWDAVVDKDGKMTTPPADASPFYKADTDQSLDSADMNSLTFTPSVHVNTPLAFLSTVDGFIKNSATLGLAKAKIPGLSKLASANYDNMVNAACTVMLHPATQDAMVIFDIAAAATTDGLYGVVKSALQAAVFYKGGAMVGQALQNYIHKLAGTGFSGAESGVDKFNAASVATDYLNSQGERGVAYGRPMSNDESAASKSLAMAEVRQNFQTKPWQERYFAVDNPFSLVGALSARVPLSFASLSTQIISSISRLPQTIANFISGQLNGGLFMRLIAGGNQQLAYAAADQNFQKDANYFGVQQWGWSQSEMDKIETDPKFSLDQNASYVEAHPEFEQQFGKCYASNLLLKDMPSGCDATTLGSDDALHWRLYKVQSFAIDSLNQDTSKDNGN